jgi:hypothetical protein
MEAAKCRLCGERHYGLCPSLKGEIISRTPGPKLGTDPAKIAIKKRREALIQSASGACPVCEARRKLKALQMQRYREKKNAS